MSLANDFMNRFEEDGRYEAGAGVLDVIFVTGKDGRYPGKLHFANGLCVRAAMEEGGDWAYPDGSPLRQVLFVLHFEGERPHGILIDDGRVVQQYDKGIVKG